MEIKDLAGLSEPLKKIIEVISSGIGTLYRPRQIRKEADANAYRKEQETIAEAKRIEIEGNAKIDLLERAKRRLVYREFQRQENIEEIAEKAIVLIDQKDVSPDKVDDDWITRFFQYAQDISTEQAREIWSRVLAKEVEQPNTISLRCLDNLKNISNKEAKLFSTLCQMLSNGNHVFYPSNSELHFEILGLNFAHIEILRDAGLIKPHHLNMINFTKESENQVLAIGRTNYLVCTKNEYGLGLIKYHQLTNVGKEIFSIMDIEPREEYFEKIIEHLKQDFDIKPWNNSG